MNHHRVAPPSRSTTPGQKAEVPSPEPTKPRIQNRVWVELAVSLPDRLPVALLGAFLVLSFATTFGVMHEWLVLPAVILAGLGFLFLTPKHRVSASKWSLVGSLASILIALVWFGGNAPFIAEWFDATRDPGLYFLHGLWFANNPASPISVVDAARLIDGIPGLDINLGSFGGGAKNLIAIQGGDLLPGAVATGFWLGGIKGALLTNLAIGSAGLVVIYGLARRLLGPLWALVPQLALGFSVAYMYFSRGTYSEIIMLLVSAAALTWVISGVRSLHWRDFLIAGAFVGVASMTRIDGVLAGLGAIVVLGVAGLGFLPRHSRKPVFVGGLVLVASSVSVTYLAYLGYKLNKDPYLIALHDQTRLLWTASGAVVVVFFLCWLAGLALKSTKVESFWTRAAGVLGVLVLGLLLFWLSRPLWYVAHTRAASGSGTIEGLQRLSGLPLDGTRSYEEQTMSWIGWYFGWPMIVLAIFGFAALVFLGVRDRKLAPLVGAIAPLVAAAVYFTNVSITPDQIWAFRRMLPVITPGFLIASTVPLVLLWRRFHSSLARVGIIAVASLVALGPVVTYNGLLLVRDGGNQRAETSAICEAIGSSKTALFIRDSAPSNYALTIRTVCRVSVVSVWSYDIEPGSLAKLQKRAGDVPVIAYNPAVLPVSAWQKGPNLQVTVPHWNKYLDHLPDAIVSQTYRLYFGTLTSGGTVIAK